MKALIIAISILAGTSLLVQRDLHEKSLAVRGGACTACGNDPAVAQCNKGSAPKAGDPCAANTPNETDCPGTVGQSCNAPGPVNQRCGAYSNACASGTLFSCVLVSANNYRWASVPNAANCGSIGTCISQP